MNHIKNNALFLIEQHTISNLRDENTQYHASKTINFTIDVLKDIISIIKNDPLEIAECAIG